jgi:hypothetical protein
MICTVDMHWSNCAQLVKNEIQKAKTPQAAMLAANEWAERYRRIYDANQASTWPSSDMDLIERFFKLLYDDTVGEYVKPVDVAVAIALKRLLPQMAIMLEFAGKITFWWTLLAPSPIANDFTEAKFVNEEIQNILRNKLNPYLNPGWEEEYKRTWIKAFEQARPGVVIP